MCGIAGFLHTNLEQKADPARLRPMLGAIVHRGPDEEGTFVDGPLAMGTRRLRVIDLASGQQPLTNEDNSIWVSFNGEIFNFEQLRADLILRGHTFKTNCDTEVLVHLYEEAGDRLVDQLNGQFAFAIWDRKKRRLLLARDRLGIRPLFYTQVGSQFYWASEIKALLTLPEVPARLDPVGLQHCFVFAAPAAPRTMFENIHQLPAGHLMTLEAGRLLTKSYWDLSFNSTGEKTKDLGEAHYIEGIRELLSDSVRMQLRADVPVGVYLSGGLDSSILAAMVRDQTGSPLQTFSIGFDVRYFDEIKYAQRVADHLGSKRQEFICREKNIVDGLPAATFHTEHPSMLTENVPLMCLSALARKDVTVILTGEGADEAFAGYRYFVLEKIRRMLGRFPLSLLAGPVRALVKRKVGLDHLFPTPDQVEAAARRYGCYPAMNFEFEIGHQLLDLVASGELSARLAGHDPATDLGYDAQTLSRWHPMDQASYFAFKLRLANHQISPLGDRATMANSVEGRYPFLDHRFVEYCARIPHHYKLKGFREKHILRQAMGHLVPADIAGRRKQPFQAPVGTAFLSRHAAPYVAEMLSRQVILEKGYFSPDKVSWILDKLRYYTENRPEDVTYDRILAELGLVAILSTHLWDELFIKNRGQVAPACPWQEGLPVRTHG
jgi:asparagine synthase (glutamine-hydrolysing)